MQSPCRPFSRPLLVDRAFFPKFKKNIKFVVVLYMYSNSHRRRIKTEEKAIPFAFSSVFYPSSMIILYCTNGGESAMNPLPPPPVSLSAKIVWSLSLFLPVSCLSSFLALPWTTPFSYISLLLGGLSSISSYFVNTSGAHVLSQTKMF